MDFRLGKCILVYWEQASERESIEREKRGREREREKRGRERERKKIGERGEMIYFRSSVK